MFILYMFIYVCVFIYTYLLMNYYVYVFLKYMSKKIYISIYF